MAIANGTCVSFCNLPKAQFGYLRRVTPVSRCLRQFCGWRHLATSRESKAHFRLSWVHPGTIAVNVTWMKKWFNACQTHRSMYLSIFNHFPVIQPVSSKFRHFSTFFAHFVLLDTHRECSHWNSGKNVGPQRTRIMWLQAVKTIWR